MKNKIQTIINGKKMEFKPYDYGLTIIAEVLEMLRKSFMFISVDKQFDSLFTALTDYVNALLPDFDGDVVDYYVLIKPTG